ncbi:transporter substrate-binding domain-containing protein [Chitinivorax sp. B]|uniref:substrate-binding periplasmic protein n=1 Tax=Chitinivorax sp. B TaxID=2502235 RepID=UPI0010F87D39|nr:transporter substrate-binding domain-containing protein [Chitinivorax sp. B]
MMVRKLLCCLCIMLCGGWLHAADFNAYTEDLPPLNYDEGGKVTGFSTELLKMVMADAGMAVKITLLPWARATLLAQQDPDGVLYTLTRTKEREDQYLWLGPISRRRIVLLKLASRPEVDPVSIEDAKRFRVGAIFESATMKRLVQLGFTEGNTLDVAPSDNSNFKKLLAKRVDMIAILDWAAAWQARQHQLPYPSLSPALTLDDSSDYYFGVNKAADMDKVDRLRTSLEKLRRNGSIDALRARYFQ